ncbi:MAG TPA: S8 family serine peptidase, partial [Alphaproteobacteria bacterium]|nr:S8 family serine peptidase [Alphaproteobacteria bacterium]
MTIASRIVLRTALAAVFVFLGVSGRAQTVRDSATTTDLKFHQFQPAVAPEKAASSTAAQLPGPNGMSLGAAQQIQALQQEKESRTPAQRKIDSNVLYTLRMLQGRPAAPGVPFLYTGIDLDENNNIVVDITANVGDSLLQQLSSAGALIFYTNAGLRSVRASIPPSQIESIAASPDVIFISPKQGWATHRVAPSLKSHTLLNRPMAPGFELREARVRKQLALAMQSVTSGTGQGSVTTEGDATHRAFDARGTFGINGAGLKIGVLSDGVTSLAQSQATGDLGTVTVLPGQTGAGDEGTAMLEIIHDMAPGASLFFATADNGITSFAQNIRDLRTAGCDIIVDDVFYFVETPFQDGQTGTVISNTNGGVVTQAVNDVVTAGALYFSSAGNEGSVDESTSGTFEGDFVPVAAGAPLPAGNVNNFGGGTVFDAINSPGLGFIGLWWADPLGGSVNDYDFYILNNTSTAILASSTNIQNGTQDPFESVSAGITPGNRVGVFQKTGAANRFFHVGNLRGTLAINTTGETHGHSAASGAYTVAATPAAATPFGGPPGPFPNPFNATNVVETFSSDGLRRIFFNGDSTPITPGNFSSTGGAVLNKPDVTGADGVSVTGVGGFGSPFFGTSAAAPSAAAVAALVKSAKPTLTQAQIRTALTSTAVDIMGAGFDRDSGAGIVMAWEAVNSLGVPGAANPELGTVTAIENPGNGNGSLEAGEGGKVVIQLKNTSGVVAATGITAVLTSSTPGVIITQPNTTTYADLPAGTGVGINVSPLTFTLASNFGCGLNIDFTLTVTYTGGTTPSRALAFSVPTGLMTSFNNNLGTKPTAITGITTATGTQVNRISRNGVVSACGSVKPFPGVITNPSLTFDSYTFTACQSTCAKATLTSAGGINLFESAYSPSYDPANIGTNFKGDAGLSGTTQIFSIDLTSAT